MRSTLAFRSLLLGLLTALVGAMTLFIQPLAKLETSIDLHWLLLCAVRETEAGDLTLRIKPDAIFLGLRQNVNETAYRLGYRYHQSPHSDFIASAIYADRDERIRDSNPFFRERSRRRDAQAFNSETQYLLRNSYLSLTTRSLSENRSRSEGKRF